MLNPVLWTRIGFNADPDPDSAFDLNLDPSLGSQTNADPDPNPDLDLDPGQTLKLQQFEFLNAEYIKSR